MVFVFQKFVFLNLMFRLLRRSSLAQYVGGVRLMEEKPQMGFIFLTTKLKEPN